MKGSGIGGQAVMEGVMMKNGDKYAVAVRKPDKEIAVEIKDYKALGSDLGLNKIPIIRGVLAFIDSLKLGIGSLMYSASFFEEEDKPVDLKSLEKKEKQEKALMAGTVVLSVVLAIGIFMLLPYFISRVLKNVIESEALLALLEGVIRVLLFIGYVAAISRMEDIKRVFMYHGAEHKSINCIENGLELTVKNVRKQSRHHKRCGTSFLLIVMLISVLFFMFIRFDNAWLRIIARLILIPLIAGIAYEFIRLAGRSDNKVVAFLSKPGMALQNLTTAEPDDSMIECAIASVEAVFDWKNFLEHYDEKADAKNCCDDEKAKKHTGNKKATAEAKTDIKAEVKAEKEWEPFADDNEEPFAGKSDIKAGEKQKEENKAEEKQSVNKKSADKKKKKGSSTGNKKSDESDEKQVGIESPDFDESKNTMHTDDITDSVSADADAAVDAESGIKTDTDGQHVRTEGGKIDLNTPVPDDDEDDEILRALDQYFILKQKKDE